MSIFNVVFLKKFLFSAGVLGLSSIPIILLNKRGLFPEAHLADRIRRTIENPDEIYAKGLKQSELLEKILESDEMRDAVFEIFVKDIAHGHMGAQRSDDLRGLAEEERGIFEAKRSKASGKHEVQKILDSGGGTKSSLERRNLSDKSYELLRGEFLNFGRRNFLLKRDLTEAEIKENKNPYAFTREDMDKMENWSKIGFHHPENDEDSKLPREFYEEKFKIINWAYRKWYMETKPFYAWMSLWKHRETATKGELEKIYDSTKIKDNFPHKPSYEFPLFSSSDNSSLSSLTKFKSFFKDVVKANGNKKDLYVSRSYTDDNSTSIFVEGNSMYKNLYIKFAAAANLQYSKVLENISNSSSSSKSSSSTGTKTIASRNKDHTIDSYNQPYELFLFEESESTNFSTIKLDVFKESNQNNKKMADAVEIKDTPWIFIRNQAGIHAVAADSHSVSQYKSENANLEDVFNHFNYRSLQLIHREDLKIENTLDASPDAFIKSFKDYLEKNFSRLILGYLYEVVKDSNKLFGRDVDPVIVSFKSVYEKLNELEEMRRKYRWRMEMRGALISEYSKEEWELSDANKFKNASPKLGLSAPLPYSLNTEKQTNQEEDFILFRDLENLGDFDFFKSTNSPKHIAKYLKDSEYSKIKEEINKYVKNLNLILSPVSLDSERIFTGNYFANRMVDALLSKPEVLNQILFTRYLSTDYVGKFLSKNILGEKTILGKDLRLSISDDLKDNGTSDNNFTDFDWIETHDTDNIKKIYGGLEDMLKRYYHSSSFLRRLPQNPWDIVKYGGDILDKSKKDNGALSSAFRDNSGISFEQNFLLNLKDTRKNYFRFLNALIYLTRDKFEGFRKVMSSRINPFSNAWWLTLKDGSSSEPKPSSTFLSNPYLNPNFDVNQTQKKVADWSDFLRGQFYGEHLGFYLHGSPSNSTASVADSSSSKFILQNLHKFGGSADKMAEFVEKISSEGDLERVISEIKNAAKNDTSAQSTDWLSTLDLKQIYVKDNGNSTIYRSLTLRERQNLVIAFLKKVNVDISNQTIDKSKYKGVFLADPNNNYNLTDGKHTPGSEQKIKEDYFKPDEVQLKINDQTTYASKPINSSSFSSEEEFKTFVKTCKKWGFWSWIISFAMRDDVQEMALRDLQDSSDKIDPYDPRWREVLNSRFLK